MKKQQILSLCLVSTALAAAGCATGTSDDCLDGQNMCGNMCYDLYTTPDHCGSCNNNCSTKPHVVAAMCEDAQCKIVTCAKEYMDCDGDSSNGCEQYVGPNGVCQNTPNPNVCTDTVNDVNNCGTCGNSCLNKGNVSKASCANSQCQIEECAPNYMNCDGNPDNGCEKYVGAGDCSAPACAMTFKYVNVDTCASTGGSADWDTYLIGEINGWQEADNSMKMNADGSCVRTVTVSVNEGQKYKYKFFINGWAENSYHSNPDAAVDGDGNNEFTGQCGGSVEYIEKSSNSQNPPQNNTCQTTIYYTNPDSAAHTVYLIGDFNGWKEADEAFKMQHLGDGTHAIKVNVTDGQNIEYKVFIPSWDEKYQPGGDNMKATLSCGGSVGDANGKSYNGDATATIGNGGNNNPNPPVTDCTMTFTYSNEYTASSNNGGFTVNLVGSFNDWNQNDSNYLMTSDGNGNHSITIKVESGKSYTYKFHINGWYNEAEQRDDGWQNDPKNSNVDSDGNNVIVGTCGGNNGTGSSSNPSNPSSSNCWLKGPAKVENKNISFEIECKDGTSSISNISGGVSAKADGLKVTDTVNENNKYSYTVTAGSNQVYVPVWVEDKPFDWHDAVLYFAFTDRFKDGDSTNNNPRTNASVEGSANAQWLGGDFKGLQQKVEEGYFEKLGVNTLWISSISMNAQGISWGTGKDSSHSYSAYHSYWPVSAFMTLENMGDFAGAKSEGIDIQPVEPHFGSMTDLANLVDACHKRGIRVLVDFAANHVHKDSPMVAKHPDWFNDSGNPQLCDDNGNWDNYSEKCWFSKDLPDINYKNPEARRVMVEHAKLLITLANIDGFRVDAVKHMNIQFIKDLRAATDALYANSGHMFYMVGETFTGDVNLLNKYIGNELLHAQFDFPMYYAIKSHILGLGNYQDVANLRSQFNSDLMGTFLGNHDVTRALSVAAGDHPNDEKWCNNAERTDWQTYLKLKTAWTILFTNPGVPLIYYGDEYGQEGCNDPDNRRMMKFDNLNNEQQGTLAYVQKLGQIRRDHKALTRGKRENIAAGGGFWCYKVSDGNETIIVGVARDGNNQNCDLKGSYKLENLLSDGHEISDMSSLNLSTDRLQVYLVK